MQDQPDATPKPEPRVKPNAKPARRKPRAPSPRVARARAWLRKGHDPLAGLYLTIPVFLVYHLGILTMSARNGVDLVSQLMFQLIHFSTAAYVALTLGIAVGVAIAVAALRKTSRLRVTDWIPMLGESLVLAIIVPIFASWTTGKIVGIAFSPDAMPPFEKIVMAAGAGFHEELVFRVALFGGLVWLLRRLARVSIGPAVLVAALLSAAAFSAVHYVGPFGDTFMIASFIFRMFAGLMLALIYWWRGFAVAVYTHMFYDLIVFFFG